MSQELTRYVPTIGDSEEGYAIPALIVGGSDGGPAVYHQCGLHAREWITHATCLFMIVEMLGAPCPAHIRGRTLGRPGPLHAFKHARAGGFVFGPGRVRGPPRNS